MALRTTLLVAATAADFIQLEGRDLLRPMRVRNGALCCSRGQDDHWIILDQEIDVDHSGAAYVQVREECALKKEILMMRFSVNRPLTKEDLTAVGSALERNPGR